ncbi:MAG: DUF1059 domain-containing protein [Nitrosopumilaceae archaeon]
MTIKLECKDYGFECDFVVDGEGSSLIDQIRAHFESKHGIDYSSEFVIQMIVNKGHSRKSITKK